MAKPEWRDAEKERLWRGRVQAWRESGDAFIAEFAARSK